MSPRGSQKKGLLSKTVSSLWVGSESDSISKAKLFHCSRRVSSAYGNKAIPYELIQWWWESLWDSWSPLPAVACRGVLFQEGNGGNAMTCPCKENQVSVLSLSFKRVVSEIQTADLKVPNKIGHSHISSGSRHTFTYWQALATSQKPVVAFLDRLQGDCSAEKQ